MGWHGLGRLRSRTQLKPTDAPDAPEQWVPCKAMYEQCMGKARPFRLMGATHSTPFKARVVLHGKPPQGRKDRNRQGAPARNSNSRNSARRELEPRIPMASPGLELSKRQVVTLYARRIHGELPFRDLKSPRHGQGFEDSLTRKGARIEVQLLSTFVRLCYLAGRHPLRSVRCGSLADALSRQMSAVLGHATGKGAAGATLVADPRPVVFFNSCSIPVNRSSIR
jgi:hypothetical protein